MNSNNHTSIRQHAVSLKVPLLLGYAHSWRGDAAVERSLRLFRNRHGVLRLDCRVSSLLRRRCRRGRKLHLRSLFICRRRLPLFGRALALLLCFLMLALIQTDLVVVSALIPFLPFLPHGLFVGVEPKPPLFEDTVDLVL